MSGRGLFFLSFDRPNRVVFVVGRSPILRYVSTRDFPGTQVEDRDRRRGIGSLGRPSSFPVSSGTLLALGRVYQGDGDRDLWGVRGVFSGSWVDRHRREARVERLG